MAAGRSTRVEGGSGVDLSRLDSQDANEALVRYLIRDALLRQAGVSPDDAARILQGVTIKSVSEGGEEVSMSDVAAGFMVPLIFVAIFMISIFMTSGYLLQSVTEEKENRVVEIVLSSVPATPLMAGKILGLGGAGLTQVGIWATTALVAVPLLSSRIPDLGPIEVDPVMLVLALTYFVLGYVAFGAIFAAVGAMAPGNREAQQYSGFLGFAAAVPFIVFSAFLTDLHSPLVYALCLFPLTAPTSMLLVLGLSDSIPWPLVGASLTSLSLFALLATWASARIFRATVLLYGVRPTLSQIDRRHPLAAVASSAGASTVGGCMGWPHAFNVGPASESMVAPKPGPIAVRRSGGLELVDHGARGVLVLEPEGIDLRVAGLVAGHGVLREDRRRGALGLTSAAVDALVGIDEQGPIDALLEMDAVHGADGHAGLVHHVDAGLCDDVGH